MARDFKAGPRNKSGHPFFALGSPGGRKQQGAIIQTIVHVIDDAAGKDLIEQRFERKIRQVFRPGKTAQ